MIGILSEVRDHQLSLWPLAKENYLKLGNTRRKGFKLGALIGAFQCNPARIASTGAKIDKDSIKKRPCFLCKENRPDCQLSEEILPGWDFLVNPYPIFPLHFTIASTRHIPQESIPLEMIEMAEKMPGMCIFFNGARAGASAPDHLHCQAVMTAELPLMNFLESGGDVASLPFDVKYAVIFPESKGTLQLKEILQTKGIDAVTGKADNRLLNAYAWMGKDGMLRIAIVRRSAHRPSCYPLDSTIDADKSLMVSPGAIDMAGIVILPREEDFERITEKDLERIYSETALPQIKNYSK